MTRRHKECPRFRDLILLFREIGFLQYLLFLLPFILYGLLFRIPLYVLMYTFDFIVRSREYVHPKSETNRYMRFIKRRQEALSKHVAPSSTLDLARLLRDASQPGPRDKFFGCLPPEIRRRILLYAFGERTVHIDISYTLTSKPDEGGSVCASAAKTHAGLVRRLDSYDRIYDEDEWHWRWYGCFCHRSGPEDISLSLGRFRSSPGIDHRKYRSSACLKGGGVCHAWPGNQPDKCRVECLGWLLTSRQAYIEGMDVIYRENTINLSSSDIMLSCPSILPHNIRRSIRSLELAIDTQISPLKYAFEDPEISLLSLHAAPTFPSLLYLRMSPVTWDLDICIKRDQLLNHLHHHATFNPEQWRQSIPANVSVTLQRIDSLLERIAPPTAEVTVDWDLTGYHTLSNVLSECQGHVSLQMEECESGGRRYWRQIPTSIVNVPAKDTQSLDTTAGPDKRQGYWIKCDEAEDLD
ncbi:unnamed protein product [Clonostachys rhizophaga]|uniref:DUF7730 domain-containing protein n=1 Tax=Clonostachys rhizophaga TaxID=160324 RepID=A0A9N9VRK1_9HYPO|nr:unnamed protein product [Clonostachys rhizophaga]